MSWRAQRDRITVNPGGNGSDIQAAIELAWSVGAPHVEVFIPPGEWTLSDTLHLTDPTTPTAIAPAVSLIGARPAMGTAWTQYTTLVANFGDRPIIDMQRVRAANVENLQLRGTNVYALGSLAADIANNIMNDSLWMAGGITDDHVGIDIDSNAGNTSGSSAVTIRNVSIEKVAGGIAVGRNGTTLNEENFLFDHVATQLCGRYGMTFGQSQSKGNTIVGCSNYGSQYWIDCVRYGDGGGWPPKVLSANVGATNRLFNLHHGYATFCCANLYTELVAAIGTIGLGAISVSPPTIFTSCDFNFANPQGVRDVDVHGYLWRKTRFDSCYFGHDNGGQGDLRFYVGKDLVFDGCTFDSDAYNGHFPVSTQTGSDANVEYRMCHWRDDAGAATARGTPSTSDTLIGSSITLTAVSSTDKATFSQSGHGCQKGDLVKLATANAAEIKSVPQLSAYTWDGAIGVVESVAGDNVTLINVSESITLPHTGDLYRRRVTVA